MDKKIFKTMYRVWHIPQVPGKCFHVELRAYDEAVRLRDALANYDLFQLENNIKPDYCNASGVQIYQHDLTDEDLADMELEDRWVDIEDVDGLNEYLDHLLATGWLIT